VIFCFEIDSLKARNLLFLFRRLFHTTICYSIFELKVIDRNNGLDSILVINITHAKAKFNKFLTIVKCFYTCIMFRQTVQTPCYISKQMDCTDI
jgi:hypothetical protein